MDRRRLDRIQMLIRRKLSNLEVGLFHGYFGAEGFDIRDIRPYESGDSLSRIHWRNTARSDELMVWEAEPEIAMSMGVVVDLSPSMFYGTDKEMAEKIDVAYDAVAVVAYVGSRNGNRVGGIFAQNSVDGINQGQGDKHLARLLGHVSDAEPRDGTPSQLSQALDQYNARFRQRGLVVVISDFLAEGWEGQLRKVKHKHDVLAVRVIDRRELTLEPIGVVEFEDPISGKSFKIDTNSKKVRRLYADAAIEKREDIKQKIFESGAEYFALYTHGDWLEDFTHQLNRRNQRIRRGRRVA